MRIAYRQDSSVLAWWGARIECASAIARLEREGRLRRKSAMAARLRLDRFARTWDEVQPSDSVRDIAGRLLRVHDLRAADAVQLAAALAAAEGQPRTLTVVCLDDRLGTAAEREGFPLVGLDSGA
jgi:uncharacterized protein